MSVDAEKRRIRSEIRLRRREVAPQDAARAGEAVAALLAPLPELCRAGRIALFAALDDELPTRPLFEALRALGKPLFLPRVTVGDPLAFYPVTRWDDLRVGHFGVLEPPAEAEAAALGEGDVVITPGVAFDPAGNRLGRGRGYYDRTFSVDSTAGGSLLLGLGYEFQVLPRVPASAHDRGMDGIATEQRVLWVERGAS